MNTGSSSNINNVSVDYIFVDNVNQTTTAFSQPGWQIALWAITYSFIVIVSVVGNGTVIWIILSHQRMRTVTNYFIVNLAFSDLIMTALNTVFNFIYASHNVWYFGEGFCRFLNFIPVTAMFVSIYSMTAVAAERYMAIIYPFKRKLSASHTKVVIGMIWLVAFGLAFPQFFYAQINNDNGMTKCIVAWPEDFHQKHLMYHVTVIVLVYLLPLLVMFITYSAIGSALWNKAVPGDHTNRVYNQHQITAKKKFVRTMVAVVITFAVCWFPYHLYFVLGSIWKDIYRQKYIQQVYLAVFLLAMSSAMYSPIIYCCLNQRFRSGFKMAFHWCPCIKATERDKLNLTRRSPLQKIWRGQPFNTRTSTGTNTTENISLTNMYLEA
ncbi:substance-K receptor [Rhineura floridana]|uniref:substance-K receptor n=1 Tax=Rhineura floridana TaxID=261503 RepID=UPI002AC7EE82|nr:substance-K receptor [Rhineura floridana]